MSTTLTSPLGIGDKVYILVRRDATVTIQCPYCGTAGTITFAAVDNTPTTIKCPKCEGKGKLRAGKTLIMYDVKRREIVGVTLQTGAVDHNGKHVPVTYHYGGADRGSGCIEGCADSFPAASNGSYANVDSTYWLTKADAEAVSARLSAKEPE